MIDHLGVSGLLALFGVVAFGATIPVVPTGAAVSAAAVLARDEHWWVVPVVIGVGAAGAYLGDVITYAVLRAAGPPLATRVGWLHAEDPEGALQRLRAGLEEREVRSLLLSRLIPGGRIPVLLAASLGGYPLARFASANVAAALLWSAAYAAIGVLGGLIPDLRVAIVVVVVAALLAGVLMPRLRRRSRGPARSTDAQL